MGFSGFPKFSMPKLEILVGIVAYTDECARSCLTGQLTSTQNFSFRKIASV